MLKDAVHKRTLDQGTFDDVIARIVEVVEPERIVLFGSTARGTRGANSDLDLLIIKDGADPLDLMARVYRRLHGSAQQSMRSWSRPMRWVVLGIATRWS